MNKEIDILKHVQVQRISIFMQKLRLRKDQRALVTSFKKYQIDFMIPEDLNQKRFE